VESSLNIKRKQCCDGMIGIKMKKEEEVGYYSGNSQLLTMLFTSTTIQRYLMQSPKR
jgi:hypothetical protein